MNGAALVTRMRASGPARRDWALAIGLFAFGQAEYWLAHGSMTKIHGPGASAAAYIAGVTLPLAWRRRRPFPVVFAVSATLVLDAVLIGKAPQGVEVLGPLMIVMYSVAAYASLRMAVLGFVVGFAASIIEASLDPEVVTFGDLVVIEGSFFITLCGGAWVVGRFVRARRRDAERSEHRARTAERERDERAYAAVLEERTRIARELHDVIAHSVSLMGVQAGAVERVIGNDPDRARDALRSIQVTARESVGELRRLLGVLRQDGAPAELAPQPGLDAVAGLVSDARRSGFEIDVAIEGSIQHLPAGVELSAYRVIQEALTNARKHAPGCSATVRLQFSPRELHVLVTNGPGVSVNTTSPPGTGNGLLGMHERIALYGGSLDAHPSPDGGFVVHAVLPAEVSP